MAKRAHVHLVLPDAYFGLDDTNDGARRARLCALKAAEYLSSKHAGLASTVILGGWLEGAACSSHGASSVREALQRGYVETEVEPCRMSMDNLQELSRSMVFIEGNHEHRILRWALQQVVRGPLGDIVSSLAPRELLSRTAAGKERKKFKWVSYVGALPHHAIAPDLWTIHGWSFAKNAAAVHLNLARSVSIIHGHTHRRQEVSSRDPSTGRTLYGMSPGCLATLTPDYRAHSPTDWTHGFAIVYQSATDPLNWTHYLVTIRDGYCVLPDGKEITAR